MCRSPSRTGTAVHSCRRTTPSRTSASAPRYARRPSLPACVAQHEHASAAARLFLLVVPPRLLWPLLLLLLLLPLLALCCAVHAPHHTKRRFVGCRRCARGSRPRLRRSTSSGSRRVTTRASSTKRPTPLESTAPAGPRSTAARRPMAPARASTPSTTSCTGTRLRAAAVAGWLRAS